MFQISKKIDYGLKLVLALGEKGQGKVCSLKQIASEKRMPYRFISRLAVKLKKAGILGSKEGMGGGYFLKKDPESLSLAEIVRALEGEKRLVACLRSCGCELEEICESKPLWVRLQKEIIEKMENYKISELI